MSNDRSKNPGTMIYGLACLGVLAVSTVSAAPTPDSSSKYERFEIYPLDFPRATLPVGDLIVYFQSHDCTGGNLEVNYRVQNALSNPVYGTFKTNVSVNGQQHPDQTNNPNEIVGPFYGGSVVHLSTFSPGPGTYLVEIETDFEHVSVEADENNNTATKEITCLE